MSWMSNIGSEVAAQDMLNKIKELQEKNKDDPKIIAVLNELQKHAEEIIKSASEGWY